MLCDIYVAYIQAHVKIIIIIIIKKMNCNFFGLCMSFYLNNVAHLTKNIKYSSLYLMLSFTDQSNSEISGSTNAVKGQKLKMLMC